MNPNKSDVIQSQQHFKIHVKLSLGAQLDTSSKNDWWLPVCSLVEKKESAQSMEREREIHCCIYRYIQEFVVIMMFEFGEYGFIK